MLLIFTVAAVSVVLYIFFLRHRCCLILIRHLQPGSEDGAHRVPSTPLNLPWCDWLTARMETSALLSVIDSFGSWSGFQEVKISTCSYYRSDGLVLNTCSHKRLALIIKKSYDLWFNLSYILTHTWALQPVICHLVPKRQIKTVRRLTGSTRWVDLHGLQARLIF